MKAVDADDESDAVDEIRAVRLEPSGERGEAGTGDARGALGGDDHEEQQRDLLTQAQRVPSACAMNSDAIVR
jgi:hypothetical protein